MVFPLPLDQNVGECKGTLKLSACHIAQLVHVTAAFGCRPQAGGLHDYMKERAVFKCRCILQDLHGEGAAERGSEGLFD